MKYKVGSVHESYKDGSFKVTSNSGCYDVGIEFISTGFKCIVSNRQIETGKIKDKLKPSLFGVGFMGVGIHNSTNQRKAHKTWSSMLERCYNIQCQSKYPHYKGCKVDERWHNFQTFADWFIVHYRDGLVLDKDGIITNNKIYGPDTCQMIQSEINAMMPSGTEYTTWTFKHVETGEEVHVFNQHTFAKQINGKPQNVSAVVTGKARSVKGWILIKTEC